MYPSGIQLCYYKDGGDGDVDDDDDDFRGWQRHRRVLFQLRFSYVIIKMMVMVMTMMMMMTCVAGGTLYPCPAGIQLCYYRDGGSGDGDDDDDDSCGWRHHRCILVKLGFNPFRTLGADRRQHSTRP